MTRVAIYARFSSDLQDAKSIRDQLEVCRQEIGRRGWTEVAQFTDEAISAASVVTRPGLMELVRQAEERRFDVIMAEALDRFSRDLADTAQLHKQFTFYGAEVFTLSEQTVTPMHVSFKGLMGQMFLDELKRKTRRGLQGKIKDGMSAGGKCYGYKPVVGAPGELYIDEAEAEIIREIHNRYGNGESPRQISLDLNSRRIPPPRSEHWRVSTICGQPAHGNGILNNELYIGNRVWNRRTKIVDPITGKKRMKSNPESEWIRVEAADLRILTDEQWERTKNRQLAMRQVGKQNAKRPTRLLSGLLKCGACGGSMIIVAKGRYGCANRREHRCTQSKTIQASRLEARIIVAMKERLNDQTFVKHLAQQYHDAQVKAQAGNTQRRNELSKALADITGRLERAVERLIDTDGATAIAVMQKKVREMEDEQRALQTQLDALPAAPPVRLHPGAANKYADLVSRVIIAVQDEEYGAEIREAFRSLIIDVTLTADAEESDAMAIQVKGSLAALLDGEGLLKVGAGVGFEPTTFRL